jgi:hypothetical protein
LASHFRKYVSFSRLLYDHYCENFNRPYVLRESQHSKIWKQNFKALLDCTGKRGFNDTKRYFPKEKYIGVDEHVLKVKDEESSVNNDLKVNNGDSYYIGRHTIREGRMPQRFKKTPCYLAITKPFLKHVIPDIDVDKNIIAEGSYVTNKQSFHQTYT